MIKVEKLTYSFPEKELYRGISFTLEEGRHCALIGSNGTGKTTLANMIMDPEPYLFTGKITGSDSCKIGYVRQFFEVDKAQRTTVFEYLAEVFVQMQRESEVLCAEMAESEELEAVFERYQRLMDQIEAVDGNNYETNIRKQLKLAGLSHLETVGMGDISGGEYKLLQVIRQMMQHPSLLIMDEPDVFLDFENLNGLVQLINSHRGTVLVITHNRYLLNHCFDKILHLENGDVQEFDGSYVDYNFALLQRKIELQELAMADAEEIERYRSMVKRLRENATRMDNAALGRAVHAKASHLARLEARQIKEPFVEVRQPQIRLPQVVVAGSAVLQVRDYRLEYDDVLLENVNFELCAGEKVAIVGPNGTGKTTLLRHIYRNEHPAISISQDVQAGFLSQDHTETFNDNLSVYEAFEALGFETRERVKEYLAGYCFSEDMLDCKIRILSGGEKNLLQLAALSVGNADLLLLDEPTSHLDLYAQLALEKALAEYKGTVLMVSHDFYHIANCMDYVLYVEDRGIRKMRVRTFRKMVYQNHFSKEYLELEQKKKELELRVEGCLKDRDFEKAKELSGQLEVIVGQM